MPSPISKRSQPARKLEDYVLNYEKSMEAGLFPISGDKMQFVDGMRGSAGPMSFSSFLDIGFTFSFDEVEYTNLFIDSNGWAALVDPAISTASFTLSQVISGADTQNETILESFLLPSGGPAKHTLLAPWFDNLQLAFNNIDEVLNLGLIGTYAYQQYKLGKYQMPNYVDGDLGGVKYYRGNTRSGGNCLVIRWHTFAYSNFATDKDIIIFDLVLYENGKLEFRYAPLSRGRTTSHLGDATIGIFGYGGVNAGPSSPDSPRYRDFGYAIRHSQLDTRAPYRNGGTADPPFSNYITDLNSNLDWPASPNQNFGAIFHFHPPVYHKKFIKKDVISPRNSTFVGSFDDRKSIVYGSNELASYPSGLPSDYVVRSSFFTSKNYQNIVGTGSIELVREIEPSMFEHFINAEEKNDYVEDAFSEASLHEQGRSAESFFATGSSVFMGEPGSFCSPLANKSIIRMSLPINNAVQMLATSCSIYYYNKSLRQWEIPPSAVPDMCDPFDKFAFNTLGDPTNLGLTSQGYTPGSAIFEDYKGFDPYGHAVASGSLDIFRTVDVGLTPDDRNQTIKYIGRRDQNNEISVAAISDYYAESLQRSGLYEATFDECFTLPIDRQFLLEKATFELPLAMGDSWFQDRTATVRTFHSGSTPGAGGPPPPPYYYVHFAYDKGGPALTLALFCQKNLGRTSVLDLIMTGTITHVDDSIQRVDFRRTPYPYDYDYIHAISVGLPSANAVVTPEKIQIGSSTTLSYFTGSVIVGAEAAVSNGINSVLLNGMSVIRASLADPTQGIYSPTDIVEVIDSRMSASTFSYDVDNPDYGGENHTTISGIDPLGRGMSGFLPSGGSIFGYEFTTYQGNAKNDTIANPFFVNDSILRSEDSTKFQNELNDLFNIKYPSILPFSKLASIVSVANLDFSSTHASPYMLNPGDKLVLAISKTRPAISESIFTISISDKAFADVGKASTINSYTYFTGSMNGHDVLLNTGSINMSFYGTYIRGGGPVA